MIFISPPPAHPDTVINNPTEEVDYIAPCTWSCSCDWSKVYTGWIVEINGKTYHVEGDRMDGRRGSTIFLNPNKKQ